MKSVMLRLVPLILMLAACAQLPPTPQDVAAKQFQAVPGKGVIYLFRHNVDAAYDTTTLTLDGQVMGGTYVGTYFRWVVEPGRHEIRGYLGTNGQFTVDVAAGQLVFIEQRVSLLAGIPQAAFRVVPEAEGRAGVLHAYRGMQGTS